MFHFHFSAFGAGLCGLSFSETIKGGVENILVVTDHFIRLAYAVATKNQTQKTTANALYSYFLHYGFPRVPDSDQGRNFESALIQKLCALASIRTKSRTTAKCDHVC